MWAADQGNTEIAVALVEKGAAMDVQDNWVRWRGDCCVTFAKSVCVCTNHKGGWFLTVYATCMLAGCSCRLHFESDVTSQMRHVCVCMCV